MAMLGRDRRKGEEIPTPAEDRFLEVSAAMQGTLSFKDPINLRISGRFEGTLETLGNLIIGEKAQVEAQISGDSITVAGRVRGKIVAKQQLRLIAPARVTGDVTTPRLMIEDGAVLNGAVQMGEAPAQTQTLLLSIEEVAQYLEVEPTVVRQWASQGRIPATRDGESWRFDKQRLDQWVASERAR